jgi:hypothetical protein
MKLENQDLSEPCDEEWNHLNTIDHGSFYSVITKAEPIVDPCTKSF